MADLDSYAINWLASLPLELAASKVAYDYWNQRDPPNPLASKAAYDHGKGKHPFSSSAWTIILWSMVVILNLCPHKIFAEAEMVLSIIKIAAVLGFAYVTMTMLPTTHTSQILTDF